MDLRSGACCYADEDLIVIFSSIMQKDVKRLPPHCRQAAGYDRSTFYGGDARDYTDYPTAEAAAVA